MSTTHYPSHWWSFAIAGCIFVLCAMFIYWRIFRRNSSFQSQYTPIDQAKPTELYTHTYPEQTKTLTPSSRPSSSSAFKKILRLNEDGMS